MSVLIADLLEKLLAMKSNELYPIGILEFVREQDLKI